MADLFNKKNTTNNMAAVKGKKFAIAGVGAIGSHIASMLVTNKAEYVVVYDIDKYEDGNIPKSSLVIRYPEDIGKSKAVVLAERLQAIAGDGNKIVGYDMNVKRLGPLAFAGFDYLIIALDNAAMKIHLARMVKMCPKELRPIVLSCGTNEEFSEALFFNDSGACLKCTIPDSWLKETSSETVWSCSAKVNYLLPEKLITPISTSGVAGIASALDVDNMILDHLNGIKEFNESTRRTRGIYNRGGSETEIMRIRSCPVCSLMPPNDVHMLNGCTAKTTLRNLLNQIKPYFESDFTLRVHSLLIPGYPDRVYNQFVIADQCRSCGKKISVLKHSGLIRDDEVLCDSCKSVSYYGSKSTETQEPVQVREFSLSETDDEILDMTLFDLGYPIGCYYETEETNNASYEQEELSLELDDFDFASIVPKSITFALKDDVGFYSNIRYDSFEEICKKRDLIPITEYPQKAPAYEKNFPHVSYNDTAGENFGFCTGEWGGGLSDKAVETVNKAIKAVQNKK